MLLFWATLRVLRHPDQGRDHRSAGDRLRHRPGHPRAGSGPWSRARRVPATAPRRCAAAGGWVGWLVTAPDRVRGRDLAGVPVADRTPRVRPARDHRDAVERRAGATGARSATGCCCGSSLARGTAEGEAAGGDMAVDGARQGRALARTPRRSEAADAQGGASAAPMPRARRARRSRWGARTDGGAGGAPVAAHPCGRPRPWPAQARARRSTRTTARWPVTRRSSPPVASAPGEASGDADRLQPRDDTTRSTRSRTWTSLRIPPIRTP